MIIYCEGLLCLCSSSTASGHIDAISVAVTFRARVRGEDSDNKKRYSNLNNNNNSPRFAIRLLEMTRYSSSERDLLVIFFPPHVSNEQTRVSLLSTRNCATTVSGDCRVPVSLLRMGVLSRTTFLRNAFSPSKPVLPLVDGYPRINFRKVTMSFVPPSATADFGRTGNYLSQRNNIIPCIVAIHQYA